MVKKSSIENNKKTTNKFLAIIGLFIVLIAVFAFANRSGNGYTEISYSELQTKVSNKENFVLFIGRNTCSACSMYKEILNSKFAKENSKVGIFYIDMDKLADGETASFNSTYDYSSTPTTLIMTNGKLESSIKDKLVGNDVYDTLISRLKDKGYIK